ncbi:protein AF-17-like isoform X2 [Nelusetta ayraudi]|uniref:protein AF-17-like isoform X2 n=1 Tax=Nelusetta ayraudi TaxID=303726 RepID=UPI003F72C15C
MREMVGGCCVCSDERGWAENPLVYCDGHGCSVAVHQACYGIVQVPTGPWFCRKCESQERAARVRCELCPHKDGALKRTDSGGWAHVVCALYIPEVQFANVLTMEPIILQYVPHERYLKTCYICEDHGRESKASCGACMTCNRQGCRQAFHVTCAQMAGLLCEEEGPGADNVKYCGYCKHHYNKMQKKLRSSENTQSSTFAHSRGRSSSPSQDKHHHHRQRKSHKDKNRQKERHKKSSDSLCSSVTSSTIEKLSSSHHSIKDGEGRSKKLSSHGHGHRSKKTGGAGEGRSSSSCSSSPFNTGSLSSSQDFHQFSSSSRLERDHERGGDDHGAEERKERRRRAAVQEEEAEEEEEVKEDKDEDEEEEEEEEDSKYHKPPALTPADGPLGGPQGHDRSEGNSSPFENKVTISTFGSIMRITSSSSLGGSSSKIRKISNSSSSGDYKPPKPLCKPLSAPPILEEAEPQGPEAPPPPLPRERRHRSSKKSSHGPGRPRGSKNRERRAAEEGGAHGHHHHHHQPHPPAPPPPTLTSALYAGPSPHLHPHPAFPSSLTPHTTVSSFSSTTVTSSSSASTSSFSASSTSSSSSSSAGSFSTSRGNSLLGSGIYSSLKDPLSMGGGGGVCSAPLGSGVCSTSLSLGGGMCSTPLSSGLLQSHVSSLSLPSVNAVSNTQVHPGSSSSYSLTSSQPFASCLSTAPTLPPLLSQAQTSLPESDLDDCRFPCQGNSPRESLSSQSPMSCLPLLFDQRDGLGGGVRARPENVPPASSHIELLLEKHGNGEMGVNIVEMLQSLHSLQQENQRLQDQILGLTAKKDRLQLLNTELAVPFPPHFLLHQGSMHTSAQINFLSSTQDALSTNKSPLSKGCFLNDTSFVTSSESTPPPQQSPASFSQPLLNGLSRGLAPDSLGSLGNQSGSSSLPGVGGLMASVAGSPQLSVNGVLGGLNGVIQSPAQNPPQPTLPALRPQPPPLNPQALAQGFQLPKSASPSSLLSEQQKQLLLEHQQQLQQFMASQNFTPEQQVAVCQMLQRQRELQRLTLSGALASTPNSPMIAQSPGLLSSATASPLQGGQAGGGLFGLQDNALHKPGAAGEKGGDKNG